MGKTKIKEDEFPEIVKQYNLGGKTTAYDYLRSTYGIKNPYFVLDRIKRCDKYDYDPETDQFTGALTSTTADDVFMDMDELCGTAVSKRAESSGKIVDGRPAALEKLVQELISDRLLTLSQYVTIDSTTRTVYIDQSSMSVDGYRVITH